MEPLARLDSNSILAEDIFLEIFDQEDEIMKARMILSLTDRAAELGVKKKFEELLKAYKKVDREAKQRERKKPIAMLDKWTNFEGPYNNMFCGAWIAGEDGVYAQNDSQVDAVACYHPILPVERMKNLETGEEQIKIAYKRNGRWDEIIVPKTMVTSASKIVALSGRGISVTSENAKLLVRFLSDVENMNDSSRIRDNFEGMVYDMCSGKGKSRSNKELGINRENRWRNCILTNGERPLNSYVSQGGAINRILEVECKDNVYEDPQETAELVKKNYGLAGKRYIEALKSIGKEELQRMQKEFQKELKDDEAMQKQSLSLAILLTADKVATDYLFRDGEYITIKQAKTVLINRNDLSDNERCYRYLKDKIAMNEQKFDAENKVEQWGILEEGRAIIYNQAFKDLCKNGGFSDKAFLSWADRKDLIETQGGRMTKVKKVGGNPVRCVFLKLNENLDEDGFESVETMEMYEQEELPFK